MWVERWQIIKYDQSVLFPYFANRSGVWRPLNEIVTEWPLALCDDQTVDKARDFRNSDLVTRDYEGESVLGIWNPDHRRYYASEQKFHEAWLVKLYDAIRMSQQVSRFFRDITFRPSNLEPATLHSAIDIGPGKVGRRSCEVRLLVRR